MVECNGKVRHCCDSFVVCGVLGSILGVNSLIYGALKNKYDIFIYCDINSLFKCLRCQQNLNMFKFDFNVEEKDTENESVFKDKDNANANDGKKKTTIEFYESKEIKPEDDIFENLDLYKANSMEITAGDVTLSYIKSGHLLHILDNESIKDITKAEQSHSDLIPGIYEGGAKIWECTDDLISYMSTHYSANKLKDKRVLDLGCGSGVLGIYAYSCGAVVHFQDYNEDVLRKITIPNVFLNLPDDKSNNLQNVKFYSGDWAKYTEMTRGDEKFDVILTSETIYNPDNQQKLLNTLNEKLQDDGVVLLAAKTYYFGVGGGLRQFEEIMKKDERFVWTVLWTSLEGLSREILEIKKKKNTLK